MDLKKLSPWNWFKKERQQNEPQSASLPVQREGAEHPLARMHRELDRVFEEMTRGFGFPSLAGAFPAVPEQGALATVLRPRLDIAEDDKAYTITVEVPGVPRDDVDISVDDGALIIRGEKRQSREDKRDNYHCIERSYGRFQRVLDLPHDADEDNIGARFSDGVLTITVPKTEGGSRGKRIEVQG